LIASAHIAGGAVAALAGDRITKHRLLRVVVAFVLGVFSHVAMDRFRHSDYRPFDGSTVLYIALAEAVVTGGAVWMIARPRLGEHWPEYLGAGMLGATLPDAKFLASFFGSGQAAHLIERYGNRFHEFFHAPPPHSLALAWFGEVATTLAMLGLLAAFPRKDQH